jgi:hypothetical protein
MTTDSDAVTGWRFRRASPEDEPALLALFEQSFGTRVTAEHWRWKYQRPGNAPPESWVGVDSEDRPVFHYGGMWCDVMIDGEIRPAVVAVDAFTAPEVRRRGLLTLGVSRVHQAWRDSGAAVVFVLPNEEWGSRATAILGSTHIELRWWVRMLRPIRVLMRRIGRLARLPTTTQTRHDPFSGLDAGDCGIPSDSEIEGLVNRSKENGRFRMWNDRRRWRWRFQDSPVWRYEVIESRRNEELEALAAIRVIDGNRTAVISALEMADGRFGREILETAAADLKGRGFSTIRALAPSSSRLERTLKRSRFLVPHRRFRLYIKPLVSDLPVEALRRSGLWWLNAGDFDVG